MTHVLSLNVKNNEINRNIGDVFLCNWSTAKTILPNGIANLRINVS